MESIFEPHEASLFTFVPQRFQEIMGQRDYAVSHRKKEKGMLCSFPAQVQDSLNNECKNANCISWNIKGMNSAIRATEVTTHLDNLTGETTLHINHFPYQKALNGWWKSQYIYDISGGPGFSLYPIM